MSAKWFVSAQKLSMRKTPSKRQVRACKGSNGYYRDRRSPKTPLSGPRVCQQLPTGAQESREDGETILSITDRSYSELGCDSLALLCTRQRTKRDFRMNLREAIWNRGHRRPITPLKGRRSGTSQPFSVVIVACLACLGRTQLILGAQLGSLRKNRPYLRSFGRTR